MSSADDGLRALIQKHLVRPPDWLATPVETGGTHSGVPDLYWTHRSLGRQGWVECKATSGWALTFRPHQISWLERHALAGVRCHVAVRARGKGSSGGMGDALWLLRAHRPRELQELGLQCSPELVLGVWRGPPRSWDWGAVGDLLVG